MLDDNGLGLGARLGKVDWTGSRYPPRSRISHARIFYVCPSVLGGYR